MQQRPFILSSIGKRIYNVNTLFAEIDHFGTALLHK
jgi:hypothetical protein